MTIIERIDTIAPQFVNKDKTTYIEMATEQTSSCYFGKFYDQAVALRSAHNMELAFGRPGGSPGAINRKSEARSSIGFGSTGGTGDLGQTSYGQQLQTLINSVGLGTRTIGVSIGCR